MGTKNIWPLVVMVGMGLAAIVAILIFVPDENAMAGTAVVGIIAALSTLVSTVAVLNRVNTVDAQLTEVHGKVNGHLSELTSKIPDQTTASK